MRRRSIVAVLMLALAGAGCSTEQPIDEPTTTAEIAGGATSPELAVSELFRLLRRQDVGDVLALTAPDQMVVVALAEGVAVDDALLLETTGVDAIARNFWMGFRSSVLDALGDDTIEVRIGEVERLVAGDVQFARVPVLFPLDGSSRDFYVIETDSLWTIDVIASFAAALVPKIPEVADAVRRSPEASALVEVLRGLDPSLEAVGQDDDLDVAVRQAVIAALEAIRR
jgi:hypothetical protein